MQRLHIDKTIYLEISAINQAASVFQIHLIKWMLSRDIRQSLAHQVQV
jgi:hypothetical protein